MTTAAALSPGSLGFSLPLSGYLPGGNYRPLRLRDPYQEGFDVFSVQTGLQYAGASPGKLDGVLGPVMSAGIKQFQEQHDLVEDSICGGITMGVICSVCARKLNRVYQLPAGVPYGHFEHESSLLPPNYTEIRKDGSRDAGVVQENSRYYFLEHAFDVQAAGSELCSRIVAYHEKYVSWGLDDKEAWRLACGAWNAPSWTDRLARREPLAAGSKAIILAYIDDVTAYTNL